MYICDKTEIGNNLLKYRKSKGLTQAEVAEMADISDRTYANIERGEGNMRMDTMLNICKVLKITPNDIFIDEKYSAAIVQEEFINNLQNLSFHEKQTVTKLVKTYLDSIR